MINPFKSEMKETVATIESTTVHLDSMIQAYGTILQQAKQQLESLELSSSQVDALATKLATNDQLQQNIRTQVLTDLILKIKECDADSSDPDAAGMAGIVHAVTEKVQQKLNDQLTASVEAHVQNLIESGKIAENIADLIKATGEVNRALTVKQHMEGILETINS